MEGTDTSHPGPATGRSGASGSRVALAWGVHLFTASGAVVGTVALFAIGDGDLHRAALLMIVAMAIDSLDGTLARAVRVSEVLPNVDGRRLDDIVDYFNYVLVPAVFLVAAGSVLHWTVVILPILASAYGFAQAEAKTEDGFFLGFPSYWNAIAIYAWLLPASPAFGTVAVIFFSVLVFVPLKYVYPSHLVRLRTTTYALTLACALAVGYAVIDPERGRALWLPQISLLFPAWYMGLSCALGGWLRPSR